MFTISLLSHLYLRLVTHSPVSSHVALVGDGPRELFEGGVTGKYKGTWMDIAYGICV
jgi:hypothetical protein